MGKSGPVGSNFSNFKHILRIDFDKMDKQMAIEMMGEEMLDAAHKMDYEHAAHLRDEISKLEKELGKVFRQLKE